MGMRESKLLWYGDLSRGSVSHKGTPTSTLLKHSQRVLLLGNQVSPEDTKPTVTLIPGSTKELLHQERGSPRPPHKACRRRSTPSWRVEDVPASHQDSKDGRLTEIYFGSLENQLTRHTTLLSHSLRSYPSTNTHKGVLNLRMWSLKLFCWLGDVLECVLVFSELQQTSNDQGNPYI